MAPQSGQDHQSRAPRGSRRKYGLIGRTLAHSFSPRYFGDFFAREGIDASYLPYELASIEELPSLLAYGTGFRDGRTAFSDRLRRGNTGAAEKSQS